MSYIAAVAPVLGLAGAAVSAIGTVSGGEANQAAYGYQAAVAQNNQVIAEQNAVRAEQAGYAASENESLKGAAASGKVKAAQATNGVDVNTGSNVDVQASEREANQLDTETVFQNDLMKAYGYRVNAENFQSEAALDTMKSKEAVPASELAAAGGLLSGASSLGLKWGGSTGGGGGGFNSLFGGGSPSGYGTGS